MGCCRICRNSASPPTARRCNRHSLFRQHHRLCDRRRIYRLRARELARSESNGGFPWSSSASSPPQAGAARPDPPRQPPAQRDHRRGAGEGQTGRRRPERRRAGRSSRCRCRPATPSPTPARAATAATPSEIFMALGMAVHADVHADDDAVRLAGAAAGGADVAAAGGGRRVRRDGADQTPFTLFSLLGVRGAGRPGRQERDPAGRLHRDPAGSGATSGRRRCCEAGPTRLRPIIMTTMSVMVALLPIASGLEEGSELLQAAAVVLIGGLLTSTLLTLVFVPAMYTIFDDMQELVLRVFRRAPVSASSWSLNRPATGSSTRRRISSLRNVLRIGGALRPCCINVLRIGGACGPPPPFVAPLVLAAHSLPGRPPAEGPCGASWHARSCRSSLRPTLDVLASSRREQLALTSAASPATSRLAGPDSVAGPQTESGRRRRSGAALPEHAAAARLDRQARRRPLRRGRAADDGASDTVDAGAFTRLAAADGVWAID